MSVSVLNRRRVHRRLTRRTTCHGRHEGFTLIEVLISLVVLGIGLLGVAKLVAAAVRANDSAYMREQASQLGYAMLDQMRANSAGVQAGFYNGYTSASPVSAPAAGTCVVASCNAAAVASVDLYSWQTRLQTALPAGGGQIVTVVTPAGTVQATITVSWNDSLAQWSFGTASSVTPGVTTITLTSIL